MKKVLIFTGLKTLEITAIVLTVWVLSILGEMINPNWPWYFAWFPGLAVFVALPLLAIGVLGILGTGIWELIKKNWEWSEKINNRHK